MAHSESRKSIDSHEIRIGFSLIFGREEHFHLNRVSNDKGPVRCNECWLPCLMESCVASTVGHRPVAVCLLIRQLIMVDRTLDSYARRMAKVHVDTTDNFKRGFLPGVIRRRRCSFSHRHLSRLGAYFWSRLRRFGLRRNTGLSFYRP